MRKSIVVLISFISAIVIVVNGGETFSKADIEIIGNNKWITVIDEESVYYNNNHSAFTSLESNDGVLYLSFREAKSHRPSSTDKGQIRVLEYKNDCWLTNHIFFKEGVDLRDPYMINWNNHLLLYTNEFYSELLKTGWSELKPISHNVPYYPSIWKKRAYKGYLYGVANSGGKWPYLVKSEDGINWETVSEYKLGGNATEADMVFIADTMYICIRIDTPVGSNSLWGKTQYPFSTCQWSVMDISVASPEMIVHSDSTILLAGREYEYHRTDGTDAKYVSLFALNRDGGVKGRYLVDSSGVDVGYPSFVRINDGMYHMSYYTGPKNTEVRVLTIDINEDNLQQ